MKKTILLSALLAASLAFATNYNYEVTPVAGYNFAQSKTGLDNKQLYGGEVQYNGFSSVIKPELSFLYSPDVNFDAATLSSQSGIPYTSAKSDIFRTAINGVYEYKKLGSIVPLAKAGIGYEQMADDFGGNNNNGIFADLGLGAKVPFTKQIALKVEALYMLKNNRNSWDRNVALLAGLNIAFGSKSEPVAQPVAETSEPIKVVQKEVAQEEVVITKPEIDSDGDGVYDKLDKCPNTPEGSTVDANGCKIVLDDDHDGVPNSMDKCPNTPTGVAVNADGCPETINLNINFKYNSHTVQQTSLPKIDAFAEFLKKYKNYSAEITGYTDSIGSESYNKKLSQKRADAVKQLLIQKGVDASRLTTVGMGETNPIATNATAEGRAKNRRIEANLILN